MVALLGTRAARCRRWHRCGAAIARSATLWWLVVSGAGGPPRLPIRATSPPV